MSGSGTSNPSPREPRPRQQTPPLRAWQDLPRPIEGSELKVGGRGTAGSPLKAPRRTPRAHIVFGPLTWHQAPVSPLVGLMTHNARDNVSHRKTQPHVLLSGTTGPGAPRKPKAGLSHRGRREDKTPAHTSPSLLGSKQPNFPPGLMESAVMTCSAS